MVNNNYWSCTIPHKEFSTVLQIASWENVMIVRIKPLTNAEQCGFTIEACFQSMPKLC